MDKEWADRRKALDPNVYRVKQYVLNILTGSEVDGVGSNAITIDNGAFVLDTITHGILTEPDANQDGNYTLQFRDDKSIYNTFPAIAQTLYGSVFNGNTPIELPLRMFFEGSTTLSMDVRNYTNRIATFPDGFTVQVVFHGFEKWQA